MSPSEYTPLTAKLYDPILGPWLKNMRKLIAQWTYQTNAKKIIDICCGTGHQLSFFNPEKFDEIIGIDLSINMIKIAKKHNLPCTLADAANTPFDNNHFDLAIISFALHEKNFNIAKKIINETFRIIKPLGYLIVMDYCFDNKTSNLGKKIVSAIEAFVGGQHYLNFINFIKNNGLKNLIPYQPIKSKRVLYNSIAINMYQKPKP